MVENGGFHAGPALPSGQPRLQPVVSGACWRVAPLRVQVAVPIDRVLAHHIPELHCGLLQFLRDSRLLRQHPRGKLVRHQLRQLLRDEPLNETPLVVHDAVDAEIQICAVELEEFAQKFLKFMQMLAHAHLRSICRRSAWASIARRLCNCI